MKMEKLKEIIDGSNYIVFFGGAGVSTESNIPDFRSADGLYNTKNNYNYSLETMLSHSFFINHTEEFYQFYKEKMIYTKAKPNDAHLALAELEKMGKLKAVITQNIDGLHQQAGSSNVLELHGSVHRNYCTNCGKFFNLQYILNSTSVPKCDSCNNLVKPDVVLYEESLDMEIIEKAVAYIQGADVLIIGGTSLTVYPAANLVYYYKGDRLILINKTQTPQDERAFLNFNGSIGKILKEAMATR